MSVPMRRVLWFGLVLVVLKVLPIPLPARGHSWETFLFGPLLHVSYGHLFSNLVPGLLFMLFVSYRGARVFWSVTAVIWLISQAGVWLVTSPGSVHVGASGLIYGYVAYILAAAIVQRQVWYILLSVLMIAQYWALIFGVLPWTTPAGVSWQSHFFGVVGGIVAAFVVRKNERVNNAIVA